MSDATRNRARLFFAMCSSILCALIFCAIPAFADLNGDEGGDGGSGQGGGSGVGSGAAPCTTIEECKAVTIPRTLESIGIPVPGVGLIGADPYNSQHSSVSSVMSALRDQVQIDGTASGAVLPDNQRGVDSGTYNDTFKSDQQTVTDAFEGCQEEDNQHTLDELTDWLYSIIMAMPFYDGQACAMHFPYSGPTIGTCWEFIPEECSIYTPCGCISNGQWNVYDLIEYYYPTGRVNVSEQPFQSHYITTDDVSDMISNAANAYDQVGGKMKDIVTDTTSGVGPLVNKNVSQGFGQAQPSTAPWTGADDDAVSKAIAGIKGVPDSQRFRNPANHFMEARYISEDEVDGIAGGFINYLNIPHVPKSNKVMTDGSCSSCDVDAWADSRILGNSQISPGRWGPFLEPLGSSTCVQNNMMPGVHQKTPSDIMGNLLSAVPDHDPYDLLYTQGVDYVSPMYIDAKGGSPTTGDNYNLCLDNVGEVFPFTHYARLHPTDQVFQGALRMAQYIDAQDSLRYLPSFLAAYGDRFHTYVREWDKWLLLRDDGFAPSGGSGGGDADSGSGGGGSGGTQNSLYKEIGGSCSPMEEKNFGIGAISGGGGGGSGNSSSLPFLAKRNVDFDVNTMKAVQGASEATFEIWSLFKGCYAPGHQGFNIDYWLLPEEDCSDYEENCWEDDPGDSGSSETIPYGVMRLH